MTKHSRALFPKLRAWRSYSPGYTVSYSSSRNAARSPHIFCGKHEIAGARCFVGEHALLRFLTLDVSDERLGLGHLGVPAVHLLYCWRCDVGDLDYTLEQDGSVTVHGEKAWRKMLKKSGIDPRDVRKEITTNQAFPYERYPDFFPARRAVLSKLNAREQQSLLAHELGQASKRAKEPVSRHQVGGLPFLVQRSDFVPECDECDARLTFLAVIADDCADRRGFTGNSFVQVLFFICDRCNRVKAMNACD